MPQNLIFMALHFAIAKSKAAFYYSQGAMSLTNDVRRSVRELSSCNVSRLHSDFVVLID